MQYDYTKISQDMPVGGYSVEQLQKIAGQTQHTIAPAQPTKPVATSNIDTSTFGLTADELALQQAQNASIEANKKAGLSDVGTEASYTSQALQAMQAEIDATNKLYAQKLQQAQIEGQGRLGSEGAIQARRGLLGSDFGAAQTQDVRTMNTGVENAVRDEQTSKIKELMREAGAAGTAKYAAAVKAKKEGLDAYLADLGSRGETNKTIAKERAKHFLTLGVNPNTLDQTTLEQIAKAAGITSASILSSYKDVTDEEAKRVAEIGKISKAGLPASAQEYEYAVQNGYKGTFNQYQTEDANRKAKVAGAGTSGLTNAQINGTVNSIASAFDNEPIVKNFNVLNEANQKVKNLSNTTQNPADDQALVYAFAKAMDPSSAVREGEYATVQKYAQSMIAAYGKGVEQAINGTGFLTEKARTDIKKTIQANLDASRQNYNNVYKEYQKRIDTAKKGDMNSLANYANAYETPTSPTVQSRVEYPKGSGKMYNVDANGDMTPA